MRDSKWSAKAKAVHRMGELEKNKKWNVIMYITATWQSSLSVNSVHYSSKIPILLILLEMKDIVTMKEGAQTNQAATIQKYDNDFNSLCLNRMLFNTV